MHSWQTAAANILHAALEEYLAAQAALGLRRAVPLIEAHQPGWKVEHGERTYIMWAPRPEIDHGVTAGGTPVRSPGRAQLAACWDADTEPGTGGDFWRAATLDGVLAPMPADIAAAFRGSHRGGDPVSATQTHPQVHAQQCVWLECADCGTDSYNEGTPHFATEAEAQAQILGDEGYGWTERPDGRLRRRSGAQTNGCSERGIAVLTSRSLLQITCPRPSDTPLLDTWTTPF